MKIIGFAGPDGVGKTTAAEKLCHKFGGTRASFAEPIYFVLKETIYLSYRHLPRLIENRPAPLTMDKAIARDDLGGRSARYALRTLGDWGRDLNPKFWVELAMKGVQKGQTRIFDDVRYPLEAEAIRERGGLIVELRRAGVEYSDEHSSNAGLPESHIDLTWWLDDDPATPIEILRYLDQ